MTKAVVDNDDKGQKIYAKNRLEENFVLMVITINIIIIIKE